VYKLFIRAFVVNLFGSLYRIIRASVSSYSGQCIDSQVIIQEPLVSQIMFQLIHTRQMFSLRNGQVMLRYAGFKYPESQWVVILKHRHCDAARVTDIGHIILQAKNLEPICELERKLLLMCKLHGANIVLIDYLKSLELNCNADPKYQHAVNIYAHCQRLDAEY